MLSLSRRDAKAPRLGAHLGAKSLEVSSGAALSAHLGAKSLEVSSDPALSAHLGAKAPRLGARLASLDAEPRG